MECPIRLPCSHIIGSACITTWLQTRSTCPICRFEFFPAQEKASDSDDGEELDDQTLDEIQDTCVRFIGNLRSPAGYLRSPIDSASRTDVLTDMAVEVHMRNSSGGHSNRCAVALAFYIMSHIMHEPLSLVDISRVSDIPALHLERAYIPIYVYRDILIPRSLPPDIVRHTGCWSRFWDLLPPVTQTSGFTRTAENIELGSLISEDVEMTDADTASNGAVGRGESHMRPQDFCEHFCIELGYEQDVIELCQCIASKIHGLYLQGSGFQPRRTATVSVFVASHLAGFHPPWAFWTSFKNIASVVGVSEDTLREDYATIYRWRGQFMDEEILEIVGKIDIDRALAVVPPLTWPPL